MVKNTIFVSLAHEVSGIKNAISFCVMFHVPKTEDVVSIILPRENLKMFLPQNGV